MHQQQAVVKVYFRLGSGRPSEVLEIPADGKDEAERKARAIHPKAMAVLVLGWKDVRRDPVTLQPLIGR